MAANQFPLWGRDGYVYAFASGEGVFRVPGDGGTSTELLADPPGELISRLDPGTSLQAVTDILPGGRSALFTVPSDFFGFSNSFATNYDVAADGRFLMARRIDDPDAPTQGLIVVLNWIEEVREALGR